MEETKHHSNNYWRQDPLMDAKISKLKLEGKMNGLKVLPQDTN